MSKHTSGPWEVRPIGSKGDLGIYVKDAPASCGVIARIPYTDNKPCRENAALIAQAPELLARIKEAEGQEPAAYKYKVEALSGKPVIVDDPRGRLILQTIPLYARPIPAAPAVAVPDAIITKIIREVAELPDRDSPEDWPDAMLVTAYELRSILVDALVFDPLLAPAVAVPAKFTDDDLAEIHQLAYELGGTEGGEYILDGEQLDKVIVKAASLFYEPAVAVPAVPEELP